MMSNCKAKKVSVPRKTTIVTNCNIRAFSSIMAWTFAVLAQIVSAGKKNCNRLVSEQKLMAFPISNQSLILTYH